MIEGDDMKMRKVIIGFIIVLIAGVLYFGLSSLKFRLVATISQGESSSQLVLSDKWTDENIIIFNEEMSPLEFQRVEWYFDGDYDEIWQGEHDRALNRGVVSFFDTFWWMTTSLTVWAIITLMVRSIHKSKRDGMSIYGHCLRDKPTYWTFFRYDFVSRRIAIGKEENCIICKNGNRKYIEEGSGYIIAAILSLLIAFALNVYLSHQVFKLHGSELAGFQPINNTLKYLNNTTVLIKAVLVYKILSIRYVFTQFKSIR